MYVYNYNWIKFIHIWRWWDRKSISIILGGPEFESSSHNQRQFKSGFYIHSSRFYILLIFIQNNQFIRSKHSPWYHSFDVYRLFDFSTECRLPSKWERLHQLCKVTSRHISCTSHPMCGMCPQCDDGTVFTARRLLVFRWMLDAPCLLCVCRKWNK